MCICRGRRASQNAGCSDSIAGIPYVFQPVLRAHKMPRMQRESRAASCKIHANFFMSGMSGRNPSLHLISKDPADSVLDSRAVDCLYSRARHILVSDVVVDAFHSDPDISMGVRIQVLDSPEACSLCSRSQPFSRPWSWAKVTKAQALLLLLPYEFLFLHFRLQA